MKKKLNLKKSPRLKIIIFITIMIVSIILIKINLINNNNIATIVNKENNVATLKIKKGSKVYLKNENINNNENSKDEYSTENQNNKKVMEIINAKEKNERVDLENEDKNSPENVKVIETKVLEDTMIINFEKPKDIGTKYDYIIVNDQKEEQMNFYSEAGIRGYNYIIDNDINTETEKNVNKIDDSAIVLQGMEWSKDYYLHIRTIDNNGNYSDNKTFKLNLPSNGVDIKYVDINSKNEISVEEKIAGNANDDYNVENLDKKINGYSIVSTDGELVGKMKKERINIKYLYAKEASIIVKYIDKETEEEIANSKLISGYEGKEVKINQQKIKNYSYDSGEVFGKMNAGETIVKIYYDYTPEVVDTKPIITDSSQNIQKEPKKIKLKYIDFDTDKILYEEELVTSNNNIMKVKLREIEGYSLMNNIYNDNSNDNSKNDNNIISNENGNDNEQTIIDELLSGITTSDNGKEEIYGQNNNKLNHTPKEDIKAEYEIVMNCDDSDYIIYYKK